ncbi:MAG TPA: gamma-glutamyltransferase [Bryobacteraceae bacterium]|nr:gamma-glutamyltransferase [Bryobacteraceae bacterium]
MKRCLFASLFLSTAMLFGQNAEDAPQPRNKTTRPAIRGTQYAVVSMKPQASQVAERILRAGGNAFDAVVAGQAVLGLVDFPMNGVGSDAVVLVYDAKLKKVYSINAEGTAPRLATIEWYQKNAGGKIPSSDSLLSASLPGVVDAWYTLLNRWGTMTFAQVLAPAIELAENGFPISDSLAANLRTSRKIRKYPTTVKLFHLDTHEPEPGEIWRNPDLANTLRKLVAAEQAAAAQGRSEALRAARDRFYKGDIARAMGDFSEKNGGLYRYEDFAAYSAKVEDPVSIDYRGYQVYKNASSSQGPAELIALNLLEGYDLKKMGLNSPDYIHTTVEAVKLAMADRDTYLGDTDFIRIPFAGLLSKDYANERRKLIDPQHASTEFRPGRPAGADDTERPRDVQIRGTADHAGDTSYIGVVDKNRNMVSFEPSLHSAFGTGVVMGDLGFIFTCRGDYYSLVPGHANALEPGKRPRSTLQSTLVMKDNLPLMVLGSPGGDDQVLRTLQTLLNVVEFGMNVQQAIEAPRFNTTSFPSSPFPHVMRPGAMAVEDRILQDVREALIQRGHKLTVSGPWVMGSNGAIFVDHKAGALSAGADPRVEAYALAW